MKNILMTLAVATLTLSCQTKTPKETKKTTSCPERPQQSTKQQSITPADPISVQKSLSAIKTKQKKTLILTLNLPANKPQLKNENSKDLAELNDAQKKIYKLSKYDKSVQLKSNLSGKYKKFTISNNLKNKTISQYIESVKYDITVISQHYQRSSKMVKKFGDFIMLPGIAADYPYKYMTPLSTELKNCSGYQSFPYSKIHSLLRGNTKITADPDENIIRNYRLKKFKEFRQAYFDDMKEYHQNCQSDLNALRILQAKLEKAKKTYLVSTE